MSLPITLPAVPPYFATPRLDYNVAQRIQVKLQTDLTWLDRAYHIARAGVNSKDKYTYPQIQANVGGKEHFDIRVDNQCPSYCFFEIDRPFETDPQEDTLTCYFSIVFWCRLDLIDASKSYDFTSELIKEVTDLLGYFEAQELKYETRPEKIFEKYTGLTQDLKQHLIRPYSAFKLSFKIVDGYTDNCTPDEINVCQMNIDRINNLEEDVRMCVLMDICQSVPGEDATVRNSDNSYNETVASGGTLVLPDNIYRVYVNGILNQTATGPSVVDQVINIS